MVMMLASCSRRSLWSSWRHQCSLELWSLFPIAVRTFDALHIATLLFVRGEGSTVHLATYDDRLAEAAVKLGITLWEG